MQLHLKVWASAVQCGTIASNPISSILHLRSNLYLSEDLCFYPRIYHWLSPNLVSNLLNLASNFLHFSSYVYYSFIATISHNPRSSFWNHSQITQFNEPRSSPTWRVLEWPRYKKASQNYLLKMSLSHGLRIVEEMILDSIVKVD